MENCIFCKIVAGSIPCYKVYENDLFLGFLDVFPKTKGHTLIIPKKHYRWVYDVPEFGTYWETAHVVTKGIQKALQPKWLNYFTYGSVPHAHIHILPRYEEIQNTEEDTLPHKTLSFKKEEFETFTANIKNELSKF